MWEYRDNGIVSPRTSINTNWGEEIHIGTCRYCNTETSPLLTRNYNKISQFQHTFYGSLCTCPLCGWWGITFSEMVTPKYGPDGRGYGGGVIFRQHAALGALKNFDLSDISIPTEELRSYLCIKYEQRFELNPRKFEEIVADIFSDFGYYVTVTSYSGDRGIDVVAMQNEAGEEIGIQVKRYKNKIQAEQIRSLAGSLVLNDMSKGIFVTTSEFTRGAKMTATEYLERGIPIELVDGDRFYDRLRISNRTKSYDIEDPDTPFYRFIGDEGFKGLTQVYEAQAGV